MFQKAIPKQDGTNPTSLYSFFLCRTFPPWLNVRFLHFARDRSNCSFPSFSSTAFQIFPRICDLFSEVSNLQHHTKLCSRYICQSTRHQIQTDGSLRRYVLLEVYMNLNGNSVSISCNDATVLQYVCSPVSQVVVPTVLFEKTLDLEGIAWVVPVVFT